MRHVVGDRIGRTDFFRNPAFFRALVELLRPTQQPSILVHACAVGAEPYSLVMAARLAGIEDIQVDATDLEPAFLEIAQRGVYHENCLAMVPADARCYFLAGPEPRTVEVIPEIRGKVRFLAPASFVDFKPARTYDAVVALNALTYVSPEDQRTAILGMGDYARGFLGLTAASPTIIRQAIIDAGFEPIENSDWWRIYYGWRDRIRWRPGRREWALPLLPYLMRDWRWSARSLFRRRPEVRAPQ